MWNEIFFENAYSWKKIKQRHNSYMQQHTFDINIYTEFNLKDVILAIP